jgi:predicted house-cleaning NTP pyrophosphatase (Maf/HAM1 superfamily)
MTASSASRVRPPSASSSFRPALGGPLPLSRRSPWCNRRTAALVEFVDTTRVTYRQLDPDTIERYVARESPLDCAGGFKSEALGITLCESIESNDPTGLIGLPLIRLSAVLRDAGFDVP